MIRTEVVRENRVDARTGRYYERTREVFVADDGRRFSNYSDAVRHEFQLEVRRGHFNDDGIRVTRVYTDDGEWIEEEELPELIDEDDKPEREVYVERFRRPNRQKKEKSLYWGSNFLNYSLLFVQSVIQYVCKVNNIRGINKWLNK